MIFSDLFVIYYPYVCKLLDELNAGCMLDIGF